MKNKYINIDLVLEKLTFYREKLKEYNFDVKKLTEFELEEFRFLVTIEKIIKESGE